MFAGTEFLFNKCVQKNTLQGFPSKREVDFTQGNDPIAAKDRTHNLPCHLVLELNFGYLATV